MEELHTVEKYNKDSIMLQSILYPYFVFRMYFIVCTGVFCLYFIGNLDLPFVSFSLSTLVR